MSVTARPRRVTGLHRRYAPQRRHHAQPTTRQTRGRATVASIEAVAHVLPDTVVTTSEVEARLRAESPGLDFEAGLVERLTGVRERRICRPHENASDLAAAAGHAALERAGLTPADVDLLIFASSSQDLFEPATCHIVQHKLGSTATVFDHKNACNSFASAMTVAEALIGQGQFGTVLVCCGEVPSRATRYAVPDEETMRSAFTGYTVGDAGVAVVMRPSDGERGIWYRRFATDSTCWSYMAVLGGGTMHPRDPEKTYFSGDATALKQAFYPLVPPLLMAAITDTGTTIDDFAAVVSHQTSLRSVEAMRDDLGIPASKMITTVDRLGNIAAATMLVQLDVAQDAGTVRRGDDVMFIGLAAGISACVMMLKV